MGAGFLSTIKPFGIAHRGGDTGGPENSVAAFRHAVGIGFSHLETDVHLTSDGTVVAFHDSDLSRMLDRPGRIADLTWNELAELRLGDGHGIPRLADLLDEFPDARFNIDPKADEVVKPLCQLVRDSNSVDRICIGSFSDRRTYQAKELLGPELCTSAGPIDLAALLSQARLGRTISTGHSCVQIPVRQFGIRLDRPWMISRFHQAGLQVHYWTINDIDEMERLLDAGADAIITDNVTALRAVLDSRHNDGG